MSNDTEKAAAFIEPEQIKVGGHVLRPFTAASLILLQQIESPLLDSKKLAEGVPDIFFHIAAFIYLHAGDVREVRRAAMDKEAFRDAVLDFTGAMTMEQLSSASGSIQTILQRAVVGMDYQAEDGGSSPN
jgi:hypothetical protein